MEVDDEIVAAINNLAEITKETMSTLIKEMVADKELANKHINNAMDNVLETLQTIPELNYDIKSVWPSYWWTTPTN